MTPLRQQMIAALQLSGKSERTQQSYVREVRLLAQSVHAALEDVDGDGDIDMILQFDSLATKIKSGLST